MNTTKIEAVLFDFDGTLTTPGHIDFAAIRDSIGCPTGMSILTFIETLPPAERMQAETTLDEFEMRAAGTVGPADGLEEILEFLRSRSIRFGILTRNTLRAVERSLEQISCCTADMFDCLITRDDDIPVKPEPDGVIEAARRMATKPERMMVVGDYIYDIDAGIKAGALTIFLDATPDRQFAAPIADFTIGDLRSLMFHPRLN